MRRTTLLAAVAALAVAGWIALFERGEDDPDRGVPVFGLEEGDIGEIVIERPGEPLVRLYRDGEGFSVAEGGRPAAPADAEAADLLVQNVASLRFEREIEAVSESDLADFGLGPPDLAVRVTARGGPSASTALVAGFGDETPAAGNRYLRFGDRVLVTSAFARGNFDKSAWDLRDRRLFRLDSPAARRLRLTPADGTTVELARGDGVWMILRPYRFAADPYEAAQFASRLLDAAMAGLAEVSRAGAEDPFGLHPPRLSAELELVFGTGERDAAYTIHFGGESRTPPGVFARIEPDPLVFVVGRPLFDALHEAAAAELASLRYLRLFRFAAFRAVALHVTNPEGEFRFERREGDEGREWTMEEGGAAPVRVSTVTVEDLLYKLNSTDADGVGEEELPAAGAAWTVAVTEQTDDGAGASAPEAVRLAVSAAGEASALRAGDERTLAVGAEAWGAIAALFAAARVPAEDP